MRYITTRLYWRTDRRFKSSWKSPDGDGYRQFLSFGDRHDWQAPTRDAGVLVCHPFELWQARIWMKQPDGNDLNEVHSLVQIDAEARFLATLLEIDTSILLRQSHSGNIKLGVHDFILRAYLPEEVAVHLATRPLITGSEMEELVRETGPQTNWYLHHLSAENATVQSNLSAMVRDT